MNLKHLTDKILIEDTKGLISKEDETLYLLLHHLLEIDKRKLFSDLGCSSLFDYMTRKLGYSDTAAIRRIQAVRILSIYPYIGEKIKERKLTLTNISLVNGIQKDKQNIFLEKIEGKSSAEARKLFFEFTGKDSREKDSLKRNSSKSFEFKVSIDEETRNLLKEFQDLSGEKNYNVLLKNVLKTAIELKKKKQFHLRTPKEMKVVAKVGELPPLSEVIKRFPNANLKRHIYRRDQKCQICKGSYKLQFDHIYPFALG